MMKILISSRSFGKVNSSAIDRLKENGLHPNLNPYGRGLSEKETISLLDDEMFGIIAGTEKITAKIMDAAPNLKVISRYGIGIDNIDLQYAANKKIKNIKFKNSRKYIKLERMMELRIQTRTRMANEFGLQI